MNDKLDYLIINATIVDGNGGDPYLGSVGIINNIISLVKPSLIQQEAKYKINRLN